MSIVTNCSLKSNLSLSNHYDSTYLNIAAAWLSNCVPHCPTKYKIKKLNAKMHTKPRKNLKKLLSKGLTITGSL